MTDIIIPVYNAASYLRKCLDSVLNQTCKDIHIYIIDDGSTDGSSAICDEYAKFSQVTVIHQNNMGVSVSRNRGLAVASAQFIMFIDADDWIEPNTVEILQNAMKTNSADIVCGRMLMEYKSRTILPSPLLGDSVVLNREQALDAVFSKTIIGYAPWGKLYKRELFENIEFPVNKNHEDIPVTPQILLKCNKIVVINVALFHYRQQETSLSRGIYNTSHRDLYEFTKQNAYIMNIYPSLKDAYWASYYISIKDILTLFKTHKIKKEFSDDYEMYLGEIKHGILHILSNKRLGVKTKISILSILFPFRQILKSVTKNRR